MTDPVLRVLASRQALVDDGYSRGLLLSGAAHATTCFVILIVALLTPREPLIRTVIGFAVPLPRGGGLPKAAEPAAAPEEATPPPPVETAKPIEKAPAPAKLIKPEAAVVKKGVAPVDLKRSVKETKQESREVAQDKLKKPEPGKAAQAPSPGAASAATGLDFTANQPGVIDGTTGPTGPLGFYLAAAKNKIWATWARQITPDFAGNVTVAFTIHRDGAIDQVEIIQASGSATIDRLAERTLLSTQLGPLPNSYEKETLVVHANFKPIS